jgi:hypothetical protein
VIDSAVFALPAALANDPCAESNRMRKPPETAPPARPHTLRYADPNHVREPDVAVSLDWAIYQLIPSPEFAVGSERVSFGARWQLTPLLWSFATDARLSRFRYFIAEPIVRHSGSIELFFSPEYLARPARAFDQRFGFRAGVRSYFGVVERGDYLSFSIASSYYRFAGAEGATYEAGAYVLFGFLGLTVGYSPGFDDASVITTFRFKYF